LKNKTNIDLKARLEECAKSVGGKNFFLQLVEAIHEAHPHPLLNRQCEFKYPQGTIKWTKPIFRDKLTLLVQLLKNHKDGNIYPKKNSKGYKPVLNLIRTLHPITFTIQPKNKKDGQGFTLQPFDKSDNLATNINPLFEAVFFKPIYHVKKVLNAK